MFHKEFNKPCKAVILSQLMAVFHLLSGLNPSNCSKNHCDTQHKVFY